MLLKIKLISSAVVGFILVKLVEIKCGKFLLIQPVQAQVQSTTIENRATYFLTQGVARAEEEDYAEAIKNFNQAIKLNPNDADAYNNRGIVRHQLGDKTAAVEDYLQAADLYQKQGEINKYQDVLNKLRRLKQQFSPSRNQLPKAAKEQSLLTRYSLKASDLLPEPSSTVAKFSQYDFSLEKLSTPISQAVAEEPILLSGGVPVPAPTNEQPPTGESVAKKKNQYNLFNPTPKKLLREFSTDRPNLATSPLTVDAGHFYIETDVVNYTRKGSDENGDTAEKFLFASTTLRAGLTNNVEFRLLFQPYNLARTTSRGTGGVQQNTTVDVLRTGSTTNTLTTSPRPGEVQESAGFDTLQAGLKINIYGNDTYEKPGATAFGLFPFINIPTARKGLGGNSIEGGLTALFIYKISDKLDVEENLELDAIKNGASAGYHVEPFNVVSLDYQITKSLGTFFEVATRFNNESRFGAIATFDTGLLINIGNDTQLDVGAFIGLTRAANDINPYLGFSKRF